MKIDKSIPPPEAMQRNPRMTDALRSMRPGDSVLLDKKTAACLRAHGRYHKWEMTQREERGGKVRVWKLK